MGILIKNGTIVNEGQIYVADILVEDEMIKQIGQIKPRPQDMELDAGGLYVFPGFIDPHTHMELQQSPEFRAVDDFYSGTKAAAMGGTTMIIDHIAFGPADAKLHYSIDKYYQLAKKSVIDYAFHGVFQHVDADILAELRQTIRQDKIPSFKAYTTYGFEMKDKDLFQILEVMKQEKGLLTVHCENDGVTNHLKQEFLKAGKTDARYHALSRPNSVEAEAVGRLIQLAALADNAPLYIVHTSAQESLWEIETARQHGAENIFVETCTQYLLFTAEKFNPPNNEALKYMMSPPLRQQTDVEALWQGLKQGQVQVVATDHCPFLYEQKLKAATDFSKAPGGVAGVEERGQILYSKGVHEGRISLTRFVDLVSTNAAKIFGMYPRKGTLQPGSDADIVLFDPTVKHQLGIETSHSTCDYSIYQGMEVTGKVKTVLSRGKIIVDNDQFLGESGDGQFIRREREYDGRIL